MRHKQTPNVLLREEARAERSIARLRLVLAVLLAAAALAMYFSGSPALGFSYSLGLPLAWGIYAIGAALVWFQLRSKSGARWQKYMLTLYDFTFLAVYFSLAWAAGMAPDMVVGAAGSTALLLETLCALRFSLPTTALASVLGTALPILMGTAFGSSAPMKWIMASLCAGAGGIACFLSHRYRQTLRFVIERAQFERFLPRPVVEAVISGEKDIDLGGREMEASVLFADIHGFTSLCEGMRPLEVLSLLNDYFSAVAAVVFRYGGTLDKYIGDAVMAVFGAPIAHPDDAERAVRCALGIREALARVNLERDAQGLRSVTFGVGVHTGLVVAGTLGSQDRMDYTVIGDAVNVACRVEALTRSLGAQILITRATFERLPEGFRVIAAGEVHLRRRVQPIEVLKVDGI